MNSQQAAQVCEDAKKAIASGKGDLKDELILAFSETVGKLSGDLKKLQALLDSKTREIANLMFQQDVIATRVAASASETQEARALLAQISTLQ